MKNKTFSRLLAGAMCGLMVIGLAACGSGGGEAGTTAGAGNGTEAEGTTAAGTEAENAATEASTTGQPSVSGNGETYVVGISQLVTHDALDAATEGFQAALNELLPGQVTFDLQNAANDAATCATIANAFVADDVDLIMANATPALQAAAAATSDIPILGTSVTEYGVALGIEDFSGTVGTNVSGTSDLAPLEEQAAMIQEWYPDLEKVGLLYCSNEPNSQYQVDEVEKYLEDMGYTCTQYAFSDSNDVAAVCQTAADSSDVLYIPTDNTCAANTGIIDNICHGKIPVFAGEEGICSGCGVATLSISYYDIGYKTGEMAAKILTGEADVSAMPIEYAPEFVKKYNKDICSALGVTVPEGYEEITEE